MNRTDISYVHLLSLLIPRTIILNDYEDKLKIDKGILLGIISGKKQTLFT